MMANDAIDILPDIDKLALPKISVIIPVYATEKYLERCLISVLNQTLTDIEILCVDDCSPDASIDILNKYAEQDRRIKVIRHDINLGLGGARNTAIKIATAPYLASVDSDDYMLPHALQTLWDATENQTIDVVICGFARVDESDNFINKSSPGRSLHIAERNEIDIFKTNPAFWNKLWRKSLYIENNIFFPNYVYFQDLATTPRVLAFAKTVKKIPDVLFHYTQRSTSATYSRSSKHLGDYLRVYGILYDFLSDHNLMERYGKTLAMKAIPSAHAQFALTANMPENEKEQYLRELLLISIAFAEYYEDVRKINLKTICHYFKSKTLPSRLDFLNLGEVETLSISIIIKTILRPSKLKNILFSIGEYEHTKKIHFSEILVGDDSPEDVQSENEKIIFAAQEKYPHLNIKYYKYEFNIGLSAGRNRLVQASTQPFLLLCDDDFIFDGDCDLRVPISQLKQGGYDIIGGWLKNKYDIKTGSYNYWGYTGEFVFLQNEWIMYLCNNENDVPEISETNYLLNFFIARRDLFDNLMWREDLKRAEHRIFFKDFYDKKYKAAFSKSLFIKHERHNKKELNDYYNKEFGIKNRDDYNYHLFKSVFDAGVDKITVNTWQKDVFTKLSIDAVRREEIQSTIPLKESILAQKVHITRLTPKYSNYFFGYYDLKATSPDGHYTLCQSAPAMDRLPTSTDVAQLGFIDNNAPGKVTHFASTTAWCHQQGAHLQFVGSSNKVIFNIFDELKQQFRSRLFDLETQVSHDLPRPISAVSPDGKLAVSLNFSRLYDYRPSYGYGHLADSYATELAPSEDGLHILDIESGDTWLELNYEAIAAYAEPDQSSPQRQQKWVINHAAFSPSGDKILLLVRTFSNSRPFPTYTLVYDITKKQLNKVFGFCSHYHWKDNENIIMSGFPTMEKCNNEIAVYEVNIMDHNDYIAVAPDQFRGDGHCSYSPDRSLILYDSYAQNKFPYRKLQILDVHNNKCLDIGYFFSDIAFCGGDSDLRCDLHPRWSQDGKFITFDSIHEGFRGIYTCSLADIQHAFESTALYFSEEELIRWYQAKYPSANSLNKKGKQVPGKKDAALRNGSAEHVRRFLAYRFGDILINTGFLSMPFALLKEYWVYRQEKKKRGGTPLPALSDFADAAEGRKLRDTLTYRLGQIFIRDITSPLGWFRLPFSLRKVRLEHQEALKKVE